MGEKEVRGGVAGEWGEEGRRAHPCPAPRERDQAPAVGKRRHHPRRPPPLTPRRRRRPFAAGRPISTAAGRPVSAAAGRPVSAAVVPGWGGVQGLQPGRAGPADGPEHLRRRPGLPAPRYNGGIKACSDPTC